MERETEIGGGGPAVVEPSTTDFCGYIRCWQDVGEMVAQVLCRFKMQRYCSCNGWRERSSMTKNIYSLFFFYNKQNFK